MRMGQVFVLIVAVVVVVVVVVVVLNPTICAFIQPAKVYLKKNM